MDPLHRWHQLLDNNNNNNNSKREDYKVIISQQKNLFCFVFRVIKHKHTR